MLKRPSQSSKDTKQRQAYAAVQKLKDVPKTPAPTDKG